MAHGKEAAGGATSYGGTRTHNSKTGRKQVETARKGGKASGKAKRAKKTLAETARALLDSPVQPGTKVYNSVKAMGRSMDDEDITIAASIVAAQVNSAMRGNPKSFQIVRELVDEAPAERPPFVADFGLLIGPAFLGLHRAVTAGLVSLITSQNATAPKLREHAALDRTV